jgi:hypothetical protein
MIVTSSAETKTTAQSEDIMTATWRKVRCRTGELVTMDDPLSGEADATTSEVEMGMGEIVLSKGLNAVEASLMLVTFAMVGSVATTFVRDIGSLFDSGSKMERASCMMGDIVRSISIDVLNLGHSKYQVVYHVLSVHTF